MKYQDGVKSKKKVTEDFRYRKKEIAALLFAFGIISGGMSILNVMTRQDSLLWVTSLFFVCSFLFGFVAIKEPRKRIRHLFYY